MSASPENQLLLDAYLVALAYAHKMKLVTLDRGLLATHGERVVAVP